MNTPCMAPLSATKSGSRMCGREDGHSGPHRPCWRCNGHGFTRQPCQACGLLRTGNGELAREAGSIWGTPPLMTPKQKRAGA